MFLHGETGARRRLGRGDDDPPRRLRPRLVRPLAYGGRLLPEPYWQSREVDSGSAWTTIATGLSTREHGVAMLSGTIENERLFELISRVDGLIPRNLFGRPARIWARRQVLGGSPTNDDVPYKRVRHYVPDSLAVAARSPTRPRRRPE